jgi:hypothetical protein
MSRDTPARQSEPDQGTNLIGFDPFHYIIISVVEIPTGCSTFEIFFLDGSTGSLDRATAIDHLRQPSLHFLLTLL